ncbi:uncharacterized protein LOC128740850 [Sabethes cyaneus]|uniref:uncharacterized protein LOC128740850 n=1 Tax=Sabethes cyaneus TaxID=53552 RepID=UPI00237EA596|nr:uncharacterized protein LOC128740850 [Sabethes cyaneus]
MAKINQICNSHIITPIPASACPEYLPPNHKKIVRNNSSQLGSEMLRSSYRAKNFVMLTLMLLVSIVGVSITESASMLSSKAKIDGSGGGRKPSFTTYDQRQTGKYNIHVNIKDVKIISVDGEKFDGEFGDDTIYDYGDYDYDPSHLTVSPFPIFGGSATSKPPKSTTKAPVVITSTRRTSTTAKPTTTSTTSAKPSLDEEIPVKVEADSVNDTFVMEASPESQDNSTYIMAAPVATTPPPSNIYIFKPTPNYHPNPIHYDYQEIPVEVIVEPVLKPKYRNSNSRIMANRRNRYRKHPAARESVDAMARHRHSDIEALPSNGEAHLDSPPLEATPCPRGEHRDRTGKCRVRMPGISRLIKLLASFREKGD